VVTRRKRPPTLARWPARICRRIGQPAPPDRPESAARPSPRPWRRSSLFATVR